MKVLHFAIIKPNHASGLSFSIPNLVLGQNIYSNSEVSNICNLLEENMVPKKVLSKYDVVVLNSFFYKEYLKLLITIPLDIKIVICPRGAFSNANSYSLKKWIYSILFLFIIKLRGLNCTIHFLTQDEKSRSRFHLKKSFVVGNAIPIKKELNNNLALIKNKFLSKEIVYIGRFSLHIKGLDVLFEYLIKNRNKIKEIGFKFTFYGPDNKDKSILLNLSKKYKLSFVSLKNEIYEEKKNEVYRDSMFHILTSRSEGFPMSVAESTAFCTPQILSKGTNLQEQMIGQEFGVCFEQDFISKIDDINFEKYKKLAVNSWGFAKEHSLEKIGEKTINQYHNL